jgi:hypothetical protein
MGDLRREGGEKEEERKEIQAALVIRSLSIHGFDYSRTQKP